MQTILAEIGTIDVLCANAGIAGPTQLKRSRLAIGSVAYRSILRGVVEKYAAPLMTVGGCFSLYTSTAGSLGTRSCALCVGKWATD